MESTSHDLSGATEEEPKADHGSHSKGLFPIFQKNFKPQMNPLKNIQISLAESRNPLKRRKKSLLGKTETAGLSQMVLDAGQKEVGPRICPDCGLLFSPGDIQDELEHQKVHRRLSNVFTITLWKDANVLHTFVDGGTVLLADRKVEKRGGQSRLKDFCAWVDSEVGGGTELVPERSRLFLYVVPTKRKNQVRVLGCVRMEIIDDKKVIVSRIDGDEASESMTDDLKMLVGITRLWTDENYRRRQIASRLLDMVRFHSGIPGCIISRSQLGILEPTEAGKLFFGKYTGDQGSIYTYDYKLV